MSTGFAASPERSPLVRTPRLSSLCTAALCMSVSLAGCHVGASGKRADTVDSIPRLTAEDLFLVALHHQRAGDLLRAEQYLIAARGEGYDEATVVYWLVRVCVSAGRYNSALQHASDYLRAHPGNWQLRLVIASIHEALGDVGRARLELESIVDTYPEQALPHYRLAILYMESPPLVDAAIQSFRTYLRLEPNGLHARESRQAVQSSLRSFHSGGASNDRPPVKR